MDSRTVLSAALLLVVSSAHSQQDAPRVKVEYVVDARDAGKQGFRVAMTVRGVPDEDLTVAIPAWRPGTYRLMNYWTRISGMKADGDRAAASVDRQTWTVRGVRGRDVTLRYRVEPERPCLVEGPATYLYVVGHKDAACTVRFEVPDGWKVATGLDDLGDGVFGARDYDTFADGPCELGAFERRSFEEAGATWEIVVHAEGGAAWEELDGPLRKIAAEQARLFEGVPFKRYVFIFHMHKGADTHGLEHLNSTTIALNSREDWVDDAVEMASHELFHAWNVKRLRPSALGPFDYTQPVRTNALWFCEGVTEYYGQLARVRSGVIDERAFFARLEWAMMQLEQNELRTRVSLEESSRIVWDRRGEEVYLDYYGKGMLVGWLLDLKIRALTDDVKSLDDVMRTMYQTYVTGPAKEGKGPIGTGYAEDAIAKAVSEVAGRDLSGFFKRYVAGTDELPYDEVLAEAGLARRETEEGRRPGRAPGATEKQRKRIDEWLKPRRK